MSHKFSSFRKAISVNRSRLLGLPNVKFLTIGKKTIKGQKTKDVVLRFYVEEKKDVSQNYMIPKKIQIKGNKSSSEDNYIYTDVIETGGGIKALSLIGGNVIEGLTKGTVGLVYTTQLGHTFFLTNTHVVSGLNAFSFGDEVTIDTPNGSLIAGKVSRMLPIKSGSSNVNRYDGALIKPAIPVEKLAIESISPPIINYGNIRSGTETTYLYVSENQQIFCSDPEPVETPLEIEYQNRTAWFNECVLFKVTQGASLPGHSGSLLLRKTFDGYLVCGLVFAGNGEIVLVNRIRPLLTALSDSFASQNDEDENVHIDFT